MINFTDAQMLGAIDKKAQDQYNYLVELLSTYLTRGKISNVSGENFFDLANGTFNLGDKDASYVRFDATSGFEVKGTITVTGGNAETTTGAQTKVNASKDAIAENMGYTDFADMLAEATAGNTIITGGYLNTILIEAKSILAEHLDVRAVNKVNNYSVTNTTIGWGMTGGMTMDLYGSSAKVAPVHRFITNGDISTISSKFAIDPTKSYKVTLSCACAAATGTRYFGIYVYDKDNVKLSVTPFIVATRAFDTATDNPYFWSLEGAIAWTDFEGYVMSSSSVAADFRTGLNVTRHFKLPTNAAKMEIRYLNFGNAGTESTAYFYSPSVTEVGSGAITAEQVTAGKVSSTDGNAYFDLDNGELVVKNNTTYLWSSSGLYPSAPANGININTSTGAELASSYHLRFTFEEEAITNGTTVTFKAKTGYEYIAYAYDSSDVFIGALTDWETTNQTITFAQSGYIKVILHALDNSNISTWTYSFTYTIDYIPEFKVQLSKANPFRITIGEEVVAGIDSLGYISGKGININNSLFITNASPTTEVANYYYANTSSYSFVPKTLANVKAEIVTKAAIEAVLTGAITSHSHAGVITKSVNIAVSSSVTVTVSAAGTFLIFTRRRTTTGVNGAYVVSTYLISANRWLIDTLSAGTDATVSATGNATFSIANGSADYTMDVTVVSQNGAEFAFS